MDEEINKGNRSELKELKKLRGVGEGERAAEVRKGDRFLEQRILKGAGEKNRKKGLSQEVGKKQLIELLTGNEG